MSDALRTKKLLLTPASHIKPRRQKWLWEPFKGQGVIPLGTATIVAGKGGEGKTTFMLDLAAQASRGQLSGDLYGKLLTTIIIGPEDDWDTVMVPRLMAAGTDLDRVFKIDAQTEENNLTRERSLKFPLDVDLIEQAIQETGAKIIVVDPAPSVMGGDMNKAQEVRSSYEPLIALAQKYEFSLILINHFNKGGTSVSGGLSGSHAWRDLTRSYLAFATNDETGERIFSQDKNNYGESKGSYKFALESVDVDLGDGETSNVAKVRFLGETDETVGDLMAQGRGEDPEHEDRNAAQAFILDFIKQTETWEAKAGDVLKAGRGAGFSDMDLKNARRRSKSPKIVSRKSDFSSGWVWAIEDKLAQGVTQGAVGVTVPEHDTLGTFMTPSTDLTPVICKLHGTEDIEECYTCTQIREAASA